MGTGRELIRTGWNLTAAAAGILLTVFTGILLVANYLSQVELRKATVERLRHDTEKRADALSYFYSERKNDMRDIRESRAISVFFQNRALGMSMKYGLEASLLGILEELERVQRDRALGKDPIYTRIVFLDDHGTVLVDTRPSPEPDSTGAWQRFLAPGSSDALILSEIKDDSRQVLISAPYFFKGKYSGQIVAEVSTQAVQTHLIKAVGGYSKRAVSVITGECSRPSTAGPDPDFVTARLSDLKSLQDADSPAFDEFSREELHEEFVINCVEVKNTPFYLVNISPVSELFGTAAPWQLLLAMGALSILVLGGTAVAWHINGRNLVLQTGLKEAARNRLELEGKNFQLEREIAERKKVEDALRESEEKYRLVVENANEAIFITQDGVIKFPNPKTLSLTGFTTDELTSANLAELLHDDDRQTVLQEHANTLESNSISRYAFRAFRKNGEELWLEANSVPSTWEERPAILNFIRDITLQKKLQAQLFHAHKMEAIGTLAGGIAHDFNNLLQVIQGYAEMLLFGKEQDDPFQKELEEIFFAAKRGGELTRQLLTFSRRIESKPRPIHLNRQIVETRKLLERTIPKMITIELNLATDLRPVNADPAQFEQVLMNLAVNARDAMPEGGVLTIETGNVELDELFCMGQVGVSPGEYVLLSVSDNGHGIDAGTLEHIFEPFYSTKGVGRGTGLGLAMVYGIVQSHAGCILCFSEAGKGTRFDIYLPPTNAAVRPEEKRSPQELRGGTETVLLIEDEASIRNICKQMLEQFGYRVMIAVDGDSGLRAFREHWKNTDVVLLDLIMPGMGGKECLKELLKVNPDVPVIIASGYSPDGQTIQMLENGARGFVHKPYEIRELLRVIQGVMGAPKGMEDE